MGYLREADQQVPHTRAPSKLTRRFFFFRLGAVALGLAFALVVLEISARIFLYRYGNWIDRLHEDIARNYGGDLTLRDLVKPSRSPQRCYEMMPGAWGTFVGQPVKINGAGFRDREHAIQKPAGIKRIAIVGDSIAFGWGVRQEQRFSDVLENTFNSRAATSETVVECLNFAVPGYNTVMEEALFREVVLAYSPDVLVLNLVTNDDEAPNFIRLEPKVWALDRLFVLEVIRDRTVGRPLGDTARLLIGGVAEAGGRGHGQRVAGYRPELVPPEFRFLVGWANMRDALHKIARQCIDNKIKPVCLLHYDLSALEDAVRGGQKWKGLLAPWHNVAEEAGFMVVNPLDEISRHARNHRASVEPYILSAKDAHPSPLAHQLIAKALAQALEPVIFANGAEKELGKPSSAKKEKD
ncbi:MAG: SGNH/GDSL hydrolase family protein [Candidatus Sumerlaeaceae bacterium]|nr:SGNH/GDSL hydrolase family protein [Candidatus Sumerlaeaceae bacterium]